MRRSRNSGRRRRNYWTIPLSAARAAQRSLWSLQAVSLTNGKTSSMRLFVPFRILSSLRGYSLRIPAHHAYSIPLHASSLSFHSRSRRSFLLFSHLQICAESLLHPLLPQKWRRWLPNGDQWHARHSSSLLCLCMCCYHCVMSQTNNTSVFGPEYAHPTVFLVNSKELSSTRISPCTDTRRTHPELDAAIVHSRCSRGWL